MAVQATTEVILLWKVMLVAIQAVAVHLMQAEAEAVLVELVRLVQIQTLLAVAVQTRFRFTRALHLLECQDFTLEAVVLAITSTVLAAALVVLVVVGMVVQRLQRQALRTLAAAAVE